MIIGLPITGLSTMFYTVLLLGMGVAKMWRQCMAVVERASRTLRRAAQLIIAPRGDPYRSIRGG
jgi:hypothetical protein